jgi:hypothetical protein
MTYGWHYEEGRVQGEGDDVFDVIDMAFAEDDGHSPDRIMVGPIVDGKCDGRSPMPVVWREGEWCYGDDWEDGAATIVRFDGEYAWASFERDGIASTLREAMAACEAEIRRVMGEL